MVRLPQGCPCLDSVTKQKRQQIPGCCFACSSTTILPNPCCADNLSKHDDYPVREKLPLRARLPATVAEPFQRMPSNHARPNHSPRQSITVTMIIRNTATHPTILATRFFTYR